MCNKLYLYMKAHLFYFLTFFPLLLGTLLFLTLFYYYTSNASNCRVYGNITYRIELPLTVSWSNWIGFLSKLVMKYLWWSFLHFEGRCSFWCPLHEWSQPRLYHFLAQWWQSSFLVSLEIWRASWDWNDFYKSYVKYDKFGWWYNQLYKNTIQKYSYFKHMVIHFCSNIF